MCGLGVQVASTSLAIIGLANVAVSLAAGAMGTYVRMKMILFFMYLSRAVAIVIFIAAPKEPATFYLFAVVLGATWLATVPPTAGLTAKLFYVCPLGGPNIKQYENGIKNALATCYSESNFFDRKDYSLITYNIDDSYCGITWIRPWHLVPIPETIQVFGHTMTHTILNTSFKDQRPFYFAENYGECWCIDCANNWIGVLEDDDFYCVHRKDENKIFRM
jgi:hypothetical protein